MIEALALVVAVALIAFLASIGWQLGHDFYRWISSRL